MNKKVVIVGGSAGARIAAEIFTLQGLPFLFLETYAKSIDREKVIADTILEGMDFLSKENIDYFIATGDNRQRKENFDLIYKHTKKTPINCIHPTAYLSPSSVVGYGNLICPYSVIHVDAVVKNNTIINTGAIIEHDCTVGDYAQISPNTTLCGNVIVGEQAFIGAGSVVIPKISIGDGSIIAAGASVIEDVGEKKMYAGVPARFKKDIV